MIEFEGHRPIKGELISLAFNCLNYLPLGVQSRYAFNWIPIIGTFNLPHSLPLEDRSVRIPTSEWTIQCTTLYHMSDALRPHGYLVPLGELYRTAVFQCFSSLINGLADFALSMPR